MENKKGVIGIVGTLLIVVMVIMFNSTGNSANGDLYDEVSPYGEVMRELDDSIDTAKGNNDRMITIDDVENYKEELGGD